MKDFIKQGIHLNQAKVDTDTGVASLNTNRKFIGVEMNEEYFDIAKDRIEKVLNK